MFALEIDFQDGVSKPEHILVRRPHALVGGTDEAHVIIEDLKDVGYQIRLIRDIGRKFRTVPVGALENSRIKTLLVGTYDGYSTFELAGITLNITALDLDLTLREGEPSDRASVRILRQAVALDSPRFPAIVVMGSEPAIISFGVGQPVYIGRSKRCSLRLEVSDISAEHARVGFENGKFWVEDLGSTNGTFVNQQQVSGRMEVQPSTPITVGKETTLFLINSEEALNRVRNHSFGSVIRSVTEERRFPALVTVSPLARPARVVIPFNGSINIGRDPSSDIWLGAPHVSRKHCTFNLAKTGEIQVADGSTNGTGHDTGLLRRGEKLEVEGKAKVFDFGSGITVALCYNESEERQFVDSGGLLHVFQPISLATARPSKEEDEKKFERQLEELRKEKIERELPLSFLVKLYNSYGLFGKVGFLLLLLSFLFCILTVAALLISVMA